MCGIVGIVAKKKPDFNFKHKEIFSQMLFMDNLRGEDSTGIYGIRKSGNVDWKKEAESSPIFLKNSTVTKMISDIIWDYTAMVGHNRKATKGTINDENAHPFVEDNIILVHNGTLTNHKELNADVEVDSHAITHTIKEFGAEKAIKKLDGAFALAFYDILSKKLHLVRNKERPLFLGEFNNFWAFASEPWMIYSAAWRNGLKPQEIKEIPEATLFSFDLSEDEIKLTNKNVKLFTPKKEIKVYSFPENKATTNKVIDFYEKYPKESTICFLPRTLLPEAMAHRITGVLKDNPKVQINAYFSPDVTKDEVKKLFNASKLSATVVGHSYNSNTENRTIFVTNVEESIDLISANGVRLDEEALEKLENCKCFKCKSLIQDFEIEDAYVKQRTNGNFIVICPDCVDKNLAKNKHWGNILKHETSSANI